MGFIDTIKTKAKAQMQTIVLPETNDTRTIKAAHTILKEGIAHIILLGQEQQIKSLNQDCNLDKATFIDPAQYNQDEMIALLVELRGHRGVDEEQARELLKSPLYFGVMLVKLGIADGMVAGALHATSDVLRASLQILGTKKDSKLVSSFFVMDVPNCNYGENGIFVFADCGLVQNPNAEELASIASDSAKSFEALLQKKAIVAMLSHSTKGSASHDDVNKVIQATQIAKERFAHLAIDGEFQLDAAIIPSVGQSKAPQSDIAGKANVLVFPDLDAGNIGYKLVQRLANAQAYGPITQGISAPINDLSRGCSAEDIIGVVAITALQAQQNKNKG